MQELNNTLMKDGYLCPDYSLHRWELLEWKGNVRNMKCKKCGDIKLAMAKI